MHSHSQLYETAAKLVQKGKGILAADQSAKTMNKQLALLGVPEEAEMRRVYRQLLFTTPDIEKYVSGVIMYDSSIRNQTDDGTPFVDVLLSKGIIPIIKADKSTVGHTGFDAEVVTQGLDGLQERLEEYYQMGARAAKWRAVFTVTDTTPTEQNILSDVVSLARYAALCQEAGIVPMVEPEVLYSGAHDIHRAEAVTTQVLQKLFEILSWYKVDQKALVLKSSMVLAGTDSQEQSTPQEVSEATVRTFKNSVPHEVPGIVFLSGGQSPEQATQNLNAIVEVEQQEGGLPWELSFSFSRGLEKPVQEAWKGKGENIETAQKALIERLRLNVLADKGAYESNMET
ncbi:MAG: fructose-bisphosphate aldolase class I [Candidatus Azotimanducaceae bacterium]|jgi:fructose-bisphosphate aldolase class I